WKRWRSFARRNSSSGSCSLRIHASIDQRTAMKRLLALDGGGIRGVFSLEILARIEAHLRRTRGQPDLVLADYFDYVAGTSTGAIIATCLSWGMSVAQVQELYITRTWGMSVAQVQELYITRAIEIFQPAPIYRRFW